MWGQCGEWSWVLHFSPPESELRNWGFSEFAVKSLKLLGNTPEAGCNALGPFSPPLYPPLRWSEMEGGPLSNTLTSHTSSTSLSGVRVSVGTLWGIKRSYSQLQPQTHLLSNKQPT